MVNKEKEICANFAVTPQTTKVMATVHDKCLVKTEKALNLYNRYFEIDRDHIQITFVIVYCYKCSILFLVMLLISYCLI